MKIYILFLTICITSCANIKYNNGIKELMCNSIMNDSVKQKSYIILDSKDFHFENDTIHGLWIGPFYQELENYRYSFVRQNCIHEIATIDNIPIYRYYKNHKRKANIKFLYCNEDSIAITDNKNIHDTLFIEKNPMINYIMRAKLYYVKNRKIIEEKSPGRLVLPIFHREYLSR